MPSSAAAFPRLALLAATVVWGATFVILQQALEDMPVFHLLSLRFGLAALLLVPTLRHQVSWSLLRDGAETGVLLFAGFALQTFGLRWTTPSRSAFLTALSVVLVPAFAGLTGRMRLRLSHGAGAALALGGLYVLCWPRDTTALDFGPGDALTIGCAAVFAVYVLRNQQAVRRHRAAALATVQFTAIALLAAPAWIWTPAVRGEFTARSLTAVVVTGVLGTALAFVCLLYAQQKLSVVTSAVILAFEPVVAAAVSVATGAERWTAALLWGGGLVLAAVMATELGGGAAASPAETHYP